VELIVAKTGGFCFGVNRAMNTVYSNSNQKPLYTYGPIIHNPQVVKDLENKGIRAINDLNEVNEGTIIIRSHGVGPIIYKNIENRNLKYIDSTCPYVKRIHNIVSNHYQKGDQIVIVGDADHPEVKGIAGWSHNTAIIIKDISEIQKIDIEPDQLICVVAQTTYRQDKYTEICQQIKKKYPNVDTFNTICNATSERQSEAIEIAKKVDKMIVIGGKSSSNTRKLYEICKKYCRDTFHIETIQDLQLNNFKSNDKIGITAGASTPAGIIKEVIAAMNEFESTNSENFEELLEQSFVTLRSGEIVKGTVIDISDNEVSVNLGYKSDGIITKSELSNNPNVDPRDLVKVGEEIDVYILRVNDNEGIVLLSKKRVDAIKGWEVIESAYKEEKTVEGKVSEIVNGGVIVVINEIRVFIPASLLSDRYVEDLNQFMGQEIQFKIVELDRRRRRIIGNRKQILLVEQNVKKEELFSKIEVGQKISGTIRNVTNFGAFVDLGGIDGLVHVSELSWGQVSHPSDIVTPGQKVDVVILEIDRENGKVSLSMKTQENNPWNNVADKYPVGNIVKGKVVRMVPFGAFVELEPGVDGLVHISQIADKHVAKPQDELSIGEIIEVKVLDINTEAKKISLSKKEATGE
jgi:4-hydroxy-3-methylbut-2-enyl diphosphate reductase